MRRSKRNPSKKRKKKSRREKELISQDYVLPKSNNNGNIRVDEDGEGKRHRKKRGRRSEERSEDPPISEMQSTRKQQVSKVFRRNTQFDFTVGNEEYHQLTGTADEETQEMPVQNNQREPIRGKKKLRKVKKGPIFPPTPKGEGGTPALRSKRKLRKAMPCVEEESPIPPPANDETSPARGKNKKVLFPPTPQAVRKREVREDRISSLYGPAPGIPNHVEKIPGSIWMNGAGELFRIYTNSAGKDLSVNPFFFDILFSLNYYGLLGCVRHPRKVSPPFTLRQAQQLQLALRSDRHPRRSIRAD